MVFSLDTRSAKTLAWLGALWLQDMAASMEASVPLRGGDLIPFPHQVEAVYRRMLPLSPNLRFLVADEPGAGKTVITALWLAEARRLGRLGRNRVLICCPAGLTDKWQDDCRRFAGLDIAIMDRASDPGTHAMWVVSIDLLARNLELQTLCADGWDAVVFDEAHRLTTTAVGLRTVAETLCSNTPQVLLLTATPHRGDATQWLALQQLLDSGASLDSPLPPTRWIRRMKEQILDMHGQPVFRPRTVDNIRVEPRAWELDLHDRVRAHMHEWCEPEARTLVADVYAKRAASSPTALARSLERRLARLQGEEVPLPVEGEQADEELRAQAAGSIDRLAEVPVLADLLQTAQARHGESTAKLAALTELLADGQPAVVFSEYLDTAAWLAECMKHDGRKVALYHGGLNPRERDALRKGFQNGQMDLFISTDAGGEGIDLQTASLLINWDLPWSLVRLEQRCGRIHRIGQTRTARTVNMLSVGTREEDTWGTLLDRVAEASKALRGAIFDCLASAVNRAGADATSDQLVAAARAVRGEPDPDVILPPDHDFLDRCRRQAINPFHVQWWLDTCHSAGLLTVQPGGRSGQWHIQGGAVPCGEFIVSCDPELVDDGVELLSPDSPRLAVIAAAVASRGRPAGDVPLQDPKGDDANIHVYGDGRRTVLIHTRPDGSRPRVLDMGALTEWMGTADRLPGCLPDPLEARELAKSCLGTPTTLDSRRQQLLGQTQRGIGRLLLRAGDRKTRTRLRAHKPAVEVRPISHMASLPIAARSRQESSETVAVRLARAELMEQGFTVVDVSTRGQGFDLLAVRGSEERWVEVKGLQEGATEYRCTPHECQTAARHPDKYWLYIVRDCDSQPRLDTYSNPDANVMRDGRARGHVAFRLPPSQGERHAGQGD